MEWLYVAQRGDRRARPETEHVQKKKHLWNKKKMDDNRRMRERIKVTV